MKIKPYFVNRKIKKKTTRRPACSLLPKLGEKRLMVVARVMEGVVALEDRASQKSTFLEIQTPMNIFPFHLPIKCTLQSFRSQN